MKSVAEIRFTTRVADAREDPVPRAEPLALLGKAAAGWHSADPEERAALVALLEQEMRRAAEDLDYELAAQIRDQILDLKAAGGRADTRTSERADARTSGRTGAPGRGKPGGRRRGR